MVVFEKVEAIDMDFISIEDYIFMVVVKIVEVIN